MDEAEAGEAFVLLSAALNLAGFGWVVGQVEAALREGGGVSLEPIQREVDVRPAQTRLIVLLNAIEVAYFRPAALVDGLIGVTSLLQDRPQHVGEFARWMSDEGAGAYKAIDLWPFELAPLQQALSKLRDEVME